MKERKKGGRKGASERARMIAVKVVNGAKDVYPDIVSSPEQNNPSMILSARSDEIPHLAAIPNPGIQMYVSRTGMDTASYRSLLMV